MKKRRIFCSRKEYNFISDVRSAFPWAVVIYRTDDGWMAFESYDDFLEWERENLIGS